MSVCRQTASDHCTVICGPVGLSAVIFIIPPVKYMLLISPYIRHSRINVSVKPGVIFLNKICFEDYRRTVLSSNYPIISTLRKTAPVIKPGPIAYTLKIKLYGKIVRFPVIVIIGVVFY